MAPTRVVSGERRGRAEDSIYWDDATHARSPRTSRVRAALPEETTGEFPLTGTTERSVRSTTACISSCSGPAGTVMLMTGLPCRTAVTRAPETEPISVTTLFVPETCQDAERTVAVKPPEDQSVPGVPMPPVLASRATIGT